MATSKTATKKSVKKTAKKAAAKKTVLKKPSKALQKKFNEALDKQGPSTLTIEKNAATGKVAVTKRTTAPAKPAVPAVPAPVLQTVSVSALEKIVNDIEADALIIIRRNVNATLTASKASAYLGKKKAPPAKTLKGLQDRLAVFGLVVGDYEVISNSLIETKIS